MVCFYHNEDFFSAALNTDQKSLFHTAQLPTYTPWKDTERDGVFLLLELIHAPVGNF